MAYTDGYEGGYSGLNSGVVGIGIAFEQEFGRSILPHVAVPGFIGGVVCSLVGPAASCDLSGPLVTCEVV